MSRFLAAIAVAGSLFAATALEAAPITVGPITFDDQASGSGNNVLFNDPNLTLTGTTIEGRLNNLSGPQVNFESTSVIVGAGGQSEVTAQTGTFTDLAIFLADPNLTYNTIIFFVDVPQLQVDRGNPNQSGDLNITVFYTPADVNGQEASATFNISSAGNNTFTIDAADGFQITRTELLAEVPMAKVRQVRLLGVEGPDTETNVPEPAMLGLLGLGLLGLGYAVRRRRQV